MSLWNIHHTALKWRHAQNPWYIFGPAFKKNKPLHSTQININQFNRQQKLIGISNTIISTVRDNHSIPSTLLFRANVLKAYFQQPSFYLFCSILGRITSELTICDFYFRALLMFSSSFLTTYILLENSSEFLISYFLRTAPLPGVDCVLWTLFSRCPIPRCLDRRIHSPYLSPPPLLAEVFFFQGFVLFSRQSSNIPTLEIHSFTVMPFRAIDR